MVPGVDDSKFLPQECLVDLLKCVLGLTAAAESPDDLLEIEYEVANTLETFESQIRFTTLSQVLATLLSQIEPLLLLTEADGKNSVWVSGHRVCYEMLATAMDAIVTYRDSFGTYDQSVNSELPDADWIGLTNCVVEGLESKYPLTRKAAFDCAVALCKCRGSSEELYNQVESRSGSNRLIVLRGMMERRLH
ncbi:hypothetical protein BCR33DRAFT_719046 [Rhizoclosmatium globosum]|uniref:Uncharacterized protein n=1 Tax=Rhizoclosmatium globosum TaxID=329046 RepID=A0A1Y2C1M9_9FUNG|nr:hypothetical protein BCR33DRAFT_719046 [Rhizoclosmatium globosum]|eukprot:ORY40929.1 hypothetical protein BCR33DRAFT_719046 [Rhizoclosmatium globosum]